MKNLKLTILAALAIFAISCSDSQESVAPTLGEGAPQCFTVEASLDGETRIASATFIESFYLYLDQSIVDSFVKIKYDDVSMSWKAYSVADDSVEMELLILDEISQVGAVALLCDEAALSSDQFLSTYNYAVGSSPICYASSQEGSVSISDEGVISIVFSIEVACLDILLSGDATDVVGVSVSGIGSTLSWNAYTNDDATISGTSAIAADALDSSTYSLYIAPQSTTSLSISVSMNDGTSKGYMVGAAQFGAGEVSSVTLNL